MSTPLSTTREIVVIAVLSLLLAFLYNMFSPKGLPLIRVEPVKIPVDNSDLFPEPNLDSLRHAASKPDTSLWKDIKVSHPEQDKALQNRDSMKAVVQEEKKQKEMAFRIITLDQLQKLLKAHRGILFDARSEEDYLKGHIKGAKNVPGEDPGKHFEHFVELPRDTLIIIYCNNPECHLGRALAEFLATMEFKKLVLYDDGWDGWEKAHMPVDTSAVGF